MKLNLVSESASEFAKKILGDFYSRDILVPEKKEFLVDHEKSVGPYLAVKNSDGSVSYILDAASQIATLAFGFNPISFFGVLHRDPTNTGEVRMLRSAFANFLKRKVAWPDAEIFFAASGAEANEIALGECFQRRKSEKAKHVLAFEGSFHGRMTVVLSATWNPSKRIPFAWDDYGTRYAPYPESKSEITEVEILSEWRQTWINAAQKDFVSPHFGSDEVLNSEIKSLLSVRDMLVSGEIFAVIIEPMQCEGGDRYATNRFHTGLLLLCRSFGIPVVYDEVQTGFGLSEKFFWHQNFELRDEKNQILTPDYISCAKKCQVAAVISHHKIDLSESLAPVSLHRGYIQGMMIDQYADKIGEYEKKLRIHLKKLAAYHPEKILNPRTKGLSFAFDLESAEISNNFVAARFRFGLMFYPAGDKTLRFRLNLAFLDEDIELLFNQLHALADHVFQVNTGSVVKTTLESNHIDPQTHYALHEGLIAILAEQELKRESEEVCLEKFTQILHRDGNRNISCRILKAADANTYRERIEALQKKVYEPVRQGEWKKFASVLKSKNGIALILEEDETLLGICFAGPLKDFFDERLVDKDADFQDPECLYVMDTTVVPEQRGYRYGQFLRFALTLVARGRGVKKICGRNRDRMARSMLAINLGLGAVESQYGTNDYPDDFPCRDVIYYEQRLLPFPQKIFSTRELRARAVNKLTLSNFISESFLKETTHLAEILPPALQHIYTASSLSEAVDKAAKTIRFYGTTTCSFVTFAECNFGSGSFLARSLSDPQRTYYPVHRLPRPEAGTEKQVLDRLEMTLITHAVQSLWVEPICRDGFVFSREFLSDVKKICQQFAIPMVWNLRRLFKRKNISEIRDWLVHQNSCPQIVVADLENQMSFVACEKNLFISSPLMMISTWDGDEMGLKYYMESIS